MRIAFDLDDTLIPAAQAFRTEPPSSLFLSWLTSERLRRGSGELLRELVSQGHEVWVYTTSFRPPWMVRLLFRAYGVALGGVVNQTVHARVTGSQGPQAPSKFPPAFGIDVLVDDSAGVVLEGDWHGFRVVRVEPAAEDWAGMVRQQLETGVRLPAQPQAP